MTPHVLIDEGPSRLIYLPGWIAFAEANELQAYFQSLPTRQNRIRMFGKWLDEPRLTAWFGPPYTYAGISWDANAFPPFLEQLTQRVAQAFDFPFNAALINHYRSGADGMGWHRDNEPEIDQALIASLSVGATRRFSVKPIQGGPAITLELSHGDLVLMYDLQENWKHQVPKTKREVSERWNVTWRRVEAQVR